MAARLSELELSLVRAGPGWERYDALVVLADALVVADPRRAAQRAREAADFALEQDDADRAADARLVEAAAQRVIGRPHEALAALDGLLERYQESPDRRRFGRVLTEMGSANLAIQLIEYAQEFLEEAVALSTQLGDADGIARSNLALGELWLQLEQWREAIRCFDQAERADYRLAGGNRYLAAVYAGRGLALRLQQRPREALVFFDRAIDWAPALDDLLTHGRAVFHKGECLAAAGEPARAVAALREAESLATRHGFDLLRIDVAVPLAQLHMAAGEHERAEQELRAALAVFEQSPLDEREAQLHRALADACERRGRLDLAAEHHRRCHELNASSLRLASQERRQRLRLALRLRKTESEKQAAEELSRLLEQRVEQRTRDLKRAVGQLEREVAERESAERQARYVAEHDALTGLPNRTLINRQLSALLESGRGTRRLAVLFIDLAGFKEVNDACGHSVGDRVLREVSARIEACLGQADTLSRYGGDEFVLVAPSRPTAEAATALCRQLVEQFATPMVVADRSLFLGCAIGVALAPGDGADAATLIQNADTAMHHAQAHFGQPFGFFEAQMRHPLQERLALSSSLRLALQREEFCLYYQPRVARAGHGVVGFEALLRWNSAERGLVLPGEFIGVAERTGLIVELGAWVIREACRQARQWDSSALAALPIAVNLSARQLAEADLVSEIRAALRAFGVAPSRLEVEITESMLLNEPDRANEQLAELRRLGVKVALDDFGTGYSNLAMLSRLAIDYLKIDRSFVDRVAASPGHRAIVEGMIAMAKALGLQVIAEGVETAAQVAALRELGADFYQGYLFARPVPAERLEQDFLSGPIRHAEQRGLVAAAIPVAGRVPAQRRFVSRRRPTVVDPVER